MSAGTVPARALRIGELAELTGTTPRTLRYYEEIELLAGAEDRGSGNHRTYGEDDLARVREIVRLRDLLGLSLEQLKLLLDAETARAELRRKWSEAEDPVEQERILAESLVHIATQLGLVRERRAELGSLEEELVAKRRSVQSRLRDLRREA